MRRLRVFYGCSYFLDVFDKASPLSLDAEYPGNDDGLSVVKSVIFAGGSVVGGCSVAMFFLLGRVKNPHRRPITKPENKSHPS